ncbi:MAG: UbiA family prenyltransferase [Planctomycetota bacterium]|jgi:4-hydroxybenzoate polyprenyltransferase
MTRRREIQEKIFAWLQLFRLPNLFTVPGDVLAGFLLAGLATRNTDYGYKSLLFGMGASVCVYCAGLLQNDYCDRKQDATFRPDRPIPAGLISADSVLGVAMVMFMLGLLSSWAAGAFPLIVCVAMVCSVISYNCLTKKIPLLGAMNMGLCRGLNLLLGASVLGPAGIENQTILVLAGFLALYIYTLSLIAYDEQKPNELGIGRWLLLLIMICWFVSMPALPIQLPMLPIDTGVLCFIGCIALFQAITRAVKVGSCPDAKKLQSFIGEMVRLLILIQATVVAIASPLLAVILLLAWIASSWLSKYFYSS